MQSGILLVRDHKAHATATNKASLAGVSREERRELAVEYMRKLPQLVGIKRGNGCDQPGIVDDMVECLEIQGAGEGPFVKYVGSPRWAGLEGSAIALPGAPSAPRTPQPARTRCTAL